MASHDILVSFTNLPMATMQPVLRLKILLDLHEAISFESIGLGYPKPIKDVRGLAIGEERLFALFSCESIFYVAVLRQKDLAPLFYQELLDVKDGHSVLATKNNLYVVSTGTDEVLCYNLSEGEVSNPCVVWQASTSRGDTHHINSIALNDGELFITAFGPKTGSLWSSASKGYIHNITRDIRVKEDLYHPHSLSERNGHFYYCESSRHSFCSIDRPLFNVQGYSRGADWLSDELVCIASSIGRKISKSTGVIANPADPGELAGESNLVVGNIASQEIVAKIDLSWFGPEIYDVVVIKTP